MNLEFFKSYAPLSKLIKYKFVSSNFSIILGSNVLSTNALIKFPLQL